MYPFEGAAAASPVPGNEKCLDCMAEIDESPEDEYCLSCWVKRGLFGPKELQLSEIIKTILYIFSMSLRWSISQEILKSMRIEFIQPHLTAIQQDRAYLNHKNFLHPQVLAWGNTVFFEPIITILKKLLVTAQPNYHFCEVHRGFQPKIYDELLPSKWQEITLNSHPQEYLIAIFHHIKDMHLLQREHSCCCGKAFSDSQTYVNHLNTHDKEKIFRCTQPNCNKIFSRQPHLTTHEKTHKPPANQFQCPTCQKNFPTIYKLNNHLRIHQDLREFECLVYGCGSRFNDRNALTHHEKFHVPYEDRPHVCEVCNIKFATRPNLDVHKSIHTGANRVTCNSIEDPTYCDCGETWANLRGQQIHLARWLGIKNFTCDECDKKFADNGDLLKHKKTHLVIKIKNFACSFAGCKERFASGSNLSQHEKTHQEGHLLCDFSHCNEKFHNSRDLERHKRVHNGPNPYQCDICKRGFPSEAVLISHKLNDHQNAKFKCDKCNIYGTNNHASFNRHAQTCKGSR